MKRLFLLFAMLWVGNSFGQNSHELILWTRGAAVTPWYFYTGNKVTADIRYNLDEEKTAALCLGKSIGGERFSVVPEACAYAGKQKGYGPELWVLSETSKASLTSYIQYAKFREVPSFGYGWFQSEAKLSKHFAFGGGLQATKEGKLDISLDAGPSVKFYAGKMIFNVLPMWRVTPESRGRPTVSSGIFFEF